MTGVWDQVRKLFASTSDGLLGLRVLCSIPAHLFFAGVWGYALGAGLEWATAQVTPGIGVRYYDGQKNLDPKGLNELRSKSWMVILSLGF